MAIKMYTTEPYKFVSAADEGEPKTVFIVRPLTQFEYMKMAGVYSRLVAGIKFNAGDEDGSQAMLDFFASDMADQFRLMYEKFIGSNLVEVQNILDASGKPVNITEPKKLMDAIPPMTAMELIGDAISRVSVSKEERGN